MNQCYKKELNDDCILCNYFKKCYNSSMEKLKVKNSKSRKGVKPKFT